MKKELILSLSSILMCLPLIGCSSSSKKVYTPISNLDKSKKYTIKCALNYETDKELDNVINKFTKLYPNITVQLQYVENYDVNAVELLKRNKMDIIFKKDTVYSESTSNGKIISTEDYFYNYLEDKELDLYSNTSEKFINNYIHSKTFSNGKTIKYMYSIPTGGECRGLFVNKSLLKLCGLEVPTNWNEFLNCCKVLKEKGYTPIQGNPATMATCFFFGECVTNVIQDKSKYEKLKYAKEGSSELFRTSFDKLYELCTNRYYDYKEIELNDGMFLSSNEAIQIRSFLGLKRNMETLKYEIPSNNIGNVAFFPYLNGIESKIKGLVNEYQMDIDFEFMFSPTSEQGMSPTYITPYYGMVLNKNSENLDWCREFVNFYFNYPGINEGYYKDSGVIPNISDTDAYIKKVFDIDSKYISYCGDILFNYEYNAYIPLNKSLVDCSKCEAKKYMVLLQKDENGNIKYYQDDKGEYLYLSDGNGNETQTKVYKKFIGEEDSLNPGLAFCNVDYYLDGMEVEFEYCRGAYEL